MLGHAAALGIAPAHLLRADPVELPLLVAALEHAADWQREHDQHLARLIIHELAEALKRGR
jgi:ABC-type nitrate/sulfonate/bicarbonate transport system substrate-binding protein